MLVSRLVYPRVALAFRWFVFAIASSRPNVTYRCDAQVWVNYQIMATVSWNVQIAFPEPFRTLERLFSLLDLSLLRIMPLACIVPYDFLSDFYVRLGGL